MEVLCMRDHQCLHLSLLGSLNSHTYSTRNTLLDEKTGLTSCYESLVGDVYRLKEAEDDLDGNLDTRVLGDDWTSAFSACSAQISRLPSQLCTVSSACHDRTPRHVMSLRSERSC